MILFEEDWRYQDAVPDFSTRNITYLQMHGLLKKMGIRNNLFFLAIHDKDLIGLDPYSDNLSTDIKLKMITECKRNPWYYFREVARIAGGSGADAEPVRLNRANLCMWWLYYNHVTNIQIQPRQTGKSVCADTLNIEQLNFRCKNTAHNLYTKDEKLRKENIDRIKEMLEALPKWMDMRNKTDSNNSEYITINALGNKLNSHLPRASARDAEKVGRGFTSPTNFYDELPFQTWAELAYPASVSSMDAAIDRAKSNGTDYGIVITTTAGRKDDRDGKFVYDLCTKAAIWTEKFYDMPNEATLRETIRRNSSDGTETVYSVFNHRQLGFTDEWLREKMARAKGGPDAAARDYLCEWTSGNETSPFTPKMANKIRASELEVKHLQLTDYGYMVRWYIDEYEIKGYMQSAKFVVGLDTSEANGGDDIGFYMVNTATLEVVATAKINETNIIQFAQWLGEFLCEYKNVTLIPERRSTGSTIVDYLMRILPSKGEDPFRRIFNLVVHDSDLDKSRYQELRGLRNIDDVLVRYRKLFGYATSGTGRMARSKLYSDTLFTIVKKLDGNFGDRDVVNQLLGLVWKNGRIDHSDGGHDDMVVAMLLAYWFILHGKNLQHYGINPSDVMTNVIGQVQLSPQEQAMISEQNMIRDKLQQLAEQLAAAGNDDIKAYRIEMMMRNLEKKLILESNEINTVDQLIRQVKEDKEKTRESRIQQFSQNRNITHNRVNTQYSYNAPWIIDK